MSKGSNPRPIDKEKYDESFDRIFGKQPIRAIESENEKPKNDSKNKSIKNKSE